MHDYAPVGVALVTGYQKNASCGSCQVNGAQSAVSRLCTRVLVHVSDEDNGTAELLRHIGEIAHNGTYLVGTVHINVRTQISLQGVEDNEPCVGEPESFVKASVGNGERIDALVNAAYIAAVSPRRNKAGLYCIRKTVLGSLEQHRHGIELLPRNRVCLAPRHVLALCESRSDIQRKSGLALTRVALNDSDLAVRDIGVPEPFCLGLLNFSHVVNAAFCFHSESPP